MKNIQIAYEILSESRKLREKFNVTGKQFDKVHANIYSIFECYAHGIIDWDQSKNRLKTAIREYVTLYKGTSIFKEEKAKMLKEYNRIVTEYKLVLDTYKRVSEQKMTETLLNKGQLNESQAQEKSKLYFNRVLADYEVSDTVLSESWNEVIQEYPNLTAKDEQRVRMLTIFEGPTVDTTQLITTIAEEPTAISGPMQTSMRPKLRSRDMEDPGFEFNPRAGHRDQPSHPENIGLTDNPSSAPATSPRPRLRPDNLSRSTAINRAVRTAMGEGWKELPPIDRDRYQERPGLEGPFSTLSGKVVYYDPKEGAYYDPDTDMYLSYDEFKELDNDRRGMKDERDEVKEADETKYGIVRYPDTAISYIKNDGNGWEHIFDKSYGFEGPVDKEDLQYAKKIAKEKIPSRMFDATEKRWKQTSMSPEAAATEFGKENVRVKKGALRNGDDMVEVFTEDMSNDEIDAFHRALDALVHKHLGHSSDEVDERKMTKSEKAKEERLKDKYDDSDMKASMKKQYGDDWEQVYFATIRKQAMETEAKRRPDHNMQAQMRLQKIMQQAIKDSKKRRGIEDDDEKDRTDEMTSAGGIAAVAQPMGKMHRRKKTDEDEKKSPAGGPGCWKGKKIHPTKPTKMKGGKRVNNCIDDGK